MSDNGAIQQTANSKANRDDALVIAGKTFTSRLFVGTGKYASPELTVAALDASGTQLVTVAIRRLDLDNPNTKTELDYIDWQRYAVLPNTAGCRTVDEALLTARLGRSVTGSAWVKLEVIPDPKYLMPDPIATLRAAETLIAEGFTVLPYIHADPVLAKHLEEAGCATVMPWLGIGSGQDPHVEEIRIIIENARVPVVVDAGIGAPFAALAMESGADAAREHVDREGAGPVRMAAAMRQGVEAGRARTAGRIAAKPYASASSLIRRCCRDESRRARERRR
jgi:thiazole synthase